MDIDITDIEHYFSFLIHNTQLLSPRLSYVRISYYI